MMNGVDKYSTDNIADNEMIIAVDDVVKKDYDSALEEHRSRGKICRVSQYPGIGI